VAAPAAAAPAAASSSIGIGTRAAPLSAKAMPPLPPRAKDPASTKFNMREYREKSSEDRASILDKLFITKGESVYIPPSALSKAKSMQSLAHDVEALSVKPPASVSDLSAPAVKVNKSSGSLKDMKGANSAPTTLSFTSTVLDITSIAVEFGFTSPEGDLIVRKMSEGITSGVGSEAEKGLFLLKYLLLVFGRDVEPFVLPLLPTILTLHMDRLPVVKDVAADIISLLGDMFCPHAIFSVYELVSPNLAEEIDWRVKVASLKLLTGMAPRVAGIISPLLPEIIPLVSNCVGNAKKQVQEAAIDTLNAACSAISNDDIAPLVPQLVSVIARPDECGKTLDLLLETTFVSTVDASTLALITPLLGKSLRGRSSVLWRKAAKIIDNMCKLVNSSSDVLPFVPLLLPALEKAIDEVSDPEVCEIAKDARASLLRSAESSLAAPEESATAKAPLKRVRAGSVDNFLSEAGRVKLAEITVAVLVSLKEGLSPKVHLEESSANTTAILHYVAKMMGYVLVSYEEDIKANNDGKDIDPADLTVAVWRFVVSRIPMDTWIESCAPYLKPLLHAADREYKTRRSASIVDEESGDIVIDEEEAVASAETLTTSEPLPNEEDLAHLFRVAALGGMPDSQEDDDADGSNLCNIKFSLAFGGKTLLYNTYLKLGRGRRYGVMGKNGTGKTTLLTNIGTGNIEGMPSDLRTIYVQHDDQTPDNGVALLEELVATPGLVALGVTTKEARDMLEAIR
jgi:hypothetical protein